MPRTIERSIWAASQAAWGEDPSTDGSGYLPIVAEGIGDLPTGVEQLETAYQDGSNRPSANEVGRPTLIDLSFDVPVHGYAPDQLPAVDFTDLMLANLMQEQTDHADRHAVTASPGTVNSADLTPFSLVPIEIDGGVTWAHLGAETSDRFAVLGSPIVVGSDTAARTVPHRTWAPPGRQLAGGRYLSLCYQDTDLGIYRLPNCRVSKLSLEGEVGGRLMWKVSIQADEVVLDAAKTALPGHRPSPPVTPLKLLHSPINFNGQAYGSGSFSLDFGATTAPLEHQGTRTGRAAIEVMSIAPTLSISPQRTNELRDLHRGAQVGHLLVQLGRGSGHSNSLAIAMGSAQITEASPSDDSGYPRSSVTLSAKTNADAYFTVGRA